MTHSNNYAPPGARPSPGPLERVLNYAVKHAFELFMFALIAYLCAAKGISFRLDMYDPAAPAAEAQTAEVNMSSLFAGYEHVLTLFDSAPAPVTIGAQNRPAAAALETTVAIDAKHAGFNAVAETDDPAPHISNLTLVLSPDYGERKGLPRHIIAAKKQRVQNYLNRYAAAAQNEMREFGIPASITLAQGLLESNAGDSRLARQSNNHFGIKCRAKCLGCTCRNYGDDTRYDMFRVFDSAAESFREHSTLLNSRRYRKLKSHGKDYTKWAHGLKSCGYATDKRYGHKLVTIIENLGLDRFDRL